MIPKNEKQKFLEKRWEYEKWSGKPRSQNQRKEEEKEGVKRKKWKKWNEIKNNKPRRLQKVTGYIHVSS